MHRRLAAAVAVASLLLVPSSPPARAAADSRDAAIVLPACPSLREVTPPPGRPVIDLSAANARGDLVGDASTLSGSAQAYLWPHGQSPRAVVPVRNGWFYPSGINDRRQIAGTAYDRNGNQWPILVNRGVATRLALPTSGLGSGGRAFGINDAGTVVGSVFVVDEYNAQIGHAAIWRKGRVVDVGPGPRVESWAGGVNAGGDAVGGFIGGNGSVQAMLWPRHGPMAELRNPIPGSSASAGAINDHGLIVGTVWLGDITSVPVLWRDRQPVRLPFPEQAFDVVADLGHVTERGLLAGDWNDANSQKPDATRPGGVLVWQGSRLIRNWDRTEFSPRPPSPPFVVAFTDSGELVLKAFSVADHREHGYVCRVK